MGANTAMSQDALKHYPITVREEYPTLSKEAQQKFLDLYQKRSKKRWKAYILWLTYGFHYAYLAKTSTGIWFWFTAGGFGIWWLVDVFRVPRMVKDFNSHQALTIIAEVRPLEAKPLL